MSENPLVELLWSKPKTPRRGPKPRVDLAGIVAAAIRIADAEGLDAASMQRIADEVGVTKMALYRHVPGRTELIALMIEATMGPAPDTSGGWRDGLRAWADAMRAGFAAHRWLMAAASGPRLVGPVELGWLEAGLVPLAELPLNASERLDTLVLVSSHVRGIVQQEVTEKPELGISAPLAGILSERAGDFPLVSRAFAESAATEGNDLAYEYGLRLIFAGVEAMVAGRGGPGSRTGTRLSTSSRASRR
jgi:AcrR family transcriptional regulator